MADASDSILAKQQMDEVQRRLTATLKPLGFRRIRRTFNRSIEDGIVQVIGLQMGRYELPGNAHQPPGLEVLRPNLYGKFAVNLGIHIKESWLAQWNQPYPKSVADHDCDFRTRLHSPTEDDRWWSLDEPTGVTVSEVQSLLEGVGLPWLDSLGRRPLIVRDWQENTSGMPSRATAIAAILAHTGEMVGGTRILLDEMRNANAGRREWLRKFARQLGLGELAS